MATSSGSKEEFACSHRYLETIYDFAESLSKEESEQFCRHFAEFHPRMASLSNSRNGALECINILRQRNIITQNNISELKRAAEELHLSDQTRDLERYERVMSRQDMQIKVRTNSPEKRLHLLKVPFQTILQFFSERYSGKAELFHYEEGCVLLILKITTEVEGQLRADILSNSLSTALRQLIIENVDDESHDDLELTCEELDVKTTPSLQVEMKSEVAPGDNRKVAVKTEKRKRHTIIKTEPEWIQYLNISDSESDSNDEKPSGTSSKRKSKGMKRKSSSGDNRKVVIKTEKIERKTIVKTEPEWIQYLNISDSEPDSNEEKPSGTSSKRKIKELKRKRSSGDKRKAFVKTEKIGKKTIVKTEPDSESDSNEEQPAGTSRKKKTREIKGEFSSEDNRNVVVKTDKTERQTDVKTETDSESDSKEEQQAGTSSQKETKDSESDSKEEQQAGISSQKETKDSESDSKEEQQAGTSSQKETKGNSEKYPYLRAKTEETFKKNFSLIEKCRIEVISIPDYDDNGSGEDDDAEEEEDDNGSDGDDNDDDGVKGAVAKLSLVAIFVFHDLFGNEHIDSYVPLYLFKQTSNFSKGSFYELEKCLLSKDEDEVRMLVSPQSKAIRIPKRKIKNLRHERFEFNGEDYDLYQRKIKLPKVNVCEAKHCYLSYYTIYSIRGVIHDVHREEDHNTKRTIFKLSDNEHDFITVVVLDENIPEDGFLERDVLELTYLRTMYSDGETKYLLSTKHTEITHLREADDNLSRLRNSDAFCSFTSLKGIVVKCSRVGEYLSCPYCYQKKLYRLEKGTYHCKRCRYIFDKEDSNICYKVKLQIENINKEVHAGIIFKDEVEKILSVAYQEIPQKGQTEALGQFLLGKDVNVSMKTCQPPLINVFSNFKIL